MSYAPTWSKPYPEKRIPWINYTTTRRRDKVRMKPVPVVELIALDIPFDPKPLSERHLRVYVDHVKQMIVHNPLAVCISYHKRRKRTKWILPNGNLFYLRGAA